MWRVACGNKPAPGALAGRRLVKPTTVLVITREGTLLLLCGVSVTYTAANFVFSLMKTNYAKQYESGCGDPVESFIILFT